MQRLAVVGLVLVLGACSSNQEIDTRAQGEQPDDNAFMLEDLYPIHVSATTAIANVSTDDLIATYRDLLNYVEDGDKRADILARIGDLELTLQDQLTARAEEAGGQAYLADYSLAIEAYQAVLEHQPDRENNDEVLYQLAKAYDLSGQAGQAYQALTRLVNGYPQSQYFVEAQFRRGDFLFGKAQYEPAQNAYQAVVDDGQQTAFYENAVYMHGWALFKRNHYEPALESFTIVLDRAMPSSGLLEGVDPNRLALVEDSIRIMSVIFSYLDGARSIAATYDHLGPRAYEGLLYEKLGDLYVDQERYQDGIDTYKMYMDKMPYADKVPVLHNKVLDTMRMARFYNRAFEEKERFIENYAVSGDYFYQARPERQDYIKRYLYVYIDEIARFYHSRAQKARKELERFKEPPPARQAEMEADYLTATQYYEQFIFTFPEDIHSAEKSFMMGEAFSEIGEYGKAVDAYERTAYDFGINVFSEEAAYAAILAYRKQIENAEDEWQREELASRRLETQLLFVKNFSFSPYAKAVLLDSIDLLYKNNDYARAITESERFLALEPPGTEKERQTVWLVLGHSNFEMQHFAEAEKAYKEALALLEEGDERRPEIVDRIAASIYRNAESLVAENSNMEAVEEFLRVVEEAPDSQYRKNAQYDAATYLLIEQKWQRALDVTLAYRELYDPEKESLDISAKVLEAYEGLEEYEKAGAELLRISDLSTDQMKKRQSLFLAAEYYEKAGNDQRALELFRDYAHQYPEPFDLAMEVRYRLSEMYRKMGDEQRRRYWLDRLIEGDSEAGDQRTGRSRWLAAFAYNVFAEDYRKEFEEIKLTLPLRESLAGKREAMQEALKRYQRIMDYGVEEFTTQALYYVGFIYGQFSRDMMDSERPDGLNELEMEQYDILLEEQAFPFDDKAIEIHESNVENAWAGSYNQWVAKSIAALAELMPGRYDKQEQHGGFSDDIF